MNCATLESLSHLPVELTIFLISHFHCHSFSWLHFNDIIIEFIADHWNLQNSLFLENVKWTPKSDKNSYSILIVNFHLLGKVSKWNLSGHLLHEPLIDKRRKQLITTMADFSSLMGAGICIGKFIVLVQIF